MPLRPTDEATARFSLVGKCTYLLNRAVAKLTLLENDEYDETFNRVVGGAMAEQAVSHFSMK